MNIIQFRSISHQKINFCHVITERKTVYLFYYMTSKNYTRDSNP